MVIVNLYNKNLVYRLIAWWLNFLAVALAAARGVAKGLAGAALADQGSSEVQGALGAGAADEGDDGCGTLVAALPAEGLGRGAGLPGGKSDVLTEAAKGAAAHGCDGTAHRRRLRRAKLFCFRGRRTRSEIRGGQTRQARGSPSTLPLLIISFQGQ